MPEIIPAKELKRIRDKKIRALSRLGYTMDQIVTEMKILSISVSKGTVFTVINGRNTKKNREATNKRRRIKAGIKKHINNINQ